MVVVTTPRRTHSSGVLLFLALALLLNEEIRAFQHATSKRTDQLLSASRWQSLRAARQLSSEPKGASEELGLAHLYVQVNKTCDAECTRYGNCNAELGTCECPFGYTGRRVGWWDDGSWGHSEQQYQGGGLQSKRRENGQEAQRKRPTVAGDCTYYLLHLFLALLVLPAYPVDVPLSLLKCVYKVQRVVGVPDVELPIRYASIQGMRPHRRTHQRPFSAPLPRPPPAHGCPAAGPKCTEPLLPACQLGPGKEPFWGFMVPRSCECAKQAWSFFGCTEGVSRGP